MNDPLADWKQFTESPAAHGTLADVILRSWARSQDSGLVADGSLVVPRVPDDDLRERSEDNRVLLDVLEPHIEWIRNALSSVPHVIYFADPDGIVLLSRGTDEAMMEQYGLTPGHDWSETTMGTNGAGTCLATGRAVTVFGDEHFLEPLKGFVCSAAPVRAPDGSLLGALDLSTSTADGRPQNLLLVAHAAFAVEREYAMLTVEGGDHPLGGRRLPLQ